MDPSAMGEAFLSSQFLNIQELIRNREFLTDPKQHTGSLLLNASWQRGRWWATLDLLVKPSYSFTVFLFCFFPPGSCKIYLPPSKKQKTFLLYLSRFGWILGLKQKKLLWKHISPIVFQFLKSVIRSPSVSEPTPWNMVFVSTSRLLLLISV